MGTGMEFFLAWHFLYFWVSILGWIFFGVGCGRAAKDTENFERFPFFSFSFYYFFIKKERKQEETWLLLE